MNTAVFGFMCEKMKRDNSNVTFYCLLGGLIFLHLCLFNSVRIYPSTDLPAHLAEATIYKHAQESSNQLNEYYPLRLYPFATVFHIVFMGSKIFPSVELANRIFHSLYIICLPLSILLLILKLNGNKWFAFLSLLFLYNNGFSWGNTAFLFSMPFIFFFVYLSINHMEQDRLWLSIGLSLLLMFIYTIHYLSSCFCVFILLIMAVSNHKKSGIWLLKKMLIIIPVLVMIYLCSRVFYGQDIGRYFYDYYITNYFLNNSDANLALRLREFLVMDNYVLFWPGLGDNIALCFSVFIIGLLINGYKNYHKQGYKKSPVHLKFILPLIACAFFCFFFLPSKVPGNEYVYQRFPSILWLSLIIWGSLYYTNVSRRKILVIFSVCVIYLLLWGHHLTAFDRENNSLGPDFFPEHKQNKILTGLMFDAYQGRFPYYLHFPNYYIVWKQGITSTQLLKWRFLGFNNNSPRNPLPPYDSGINRHIKFNAKNLDVDYLLIRGNIQQDHAAYIDKHFRILRQAGQWSLYQRL